MVEEPDTLDITQSLVGFDEGKICSSKEEVVNSGYYLDVVGGSILFVATR